jgi:hypothetical protein
MRLLRRAALIALPIGAAGSLGLMLFAGRRNTSLLLLALFTVWVLSPFLALAWANIVSKHWQPLTRATLEWLTLFVALGSVAAYAYVALGPPRPKPASVFLVVPSVSWLLIAISVSITALTSRKP